MFPLHTLRGMAQTEMGAIRRSRACLVLTKTGKLMTADPAARWHIGTAALIGPDDGPQPDFSVAVREAALLVILTSGPTGYDELTRLLTDIHGVEGWAAAGRHRTARQHRVAGYGRAQRRTAEHRKARQRAGQRGAHRALHAAAPAVGPPAARRRTQLRRAAIADRDRSRGGAVGPARPGPAPAPSPGPGVTTPR